jgi:hypothetical protein
MREDICDMQMKHGGVQSADRRGQGGDCGGEGMHGRWVCFQFFVLGKMVLLFCKLNLSFMHVYVSTFLNKSREKWK